jgi:hypothetical protein
MLTHTIESVLDIAATDDAIMKETNDFLCLAVTNATEQLLMHNVLEAWQQEAAVVDRSVRILPSVKEMIASIPEGRYAVATSGAKTYGMLTCV